MKKIVLILAVFSCLTSVYAQLDKAEAKAWKKRMKSTSVEEYKELVEGKEDAEAAIVDMESEVSALNEENARLQQELEGAQAALLEQAKVEASEEAVDDDNAFADDSAPMKTDSKGIVYKVQIGAYKNFDLKKYFDNNANFSGEIGDDGLYRYSIGVFSDYWEADQFKKYMREMGVKGAWVVSYKNGERIDIKDALEGVH